MKRLLVTGLILVFGLTVAKADNPILTSLCNSVSCLNNFTAKTGWSFAQKQMYAGGFTDLEQTWYLSPGPGFDVPLGKGGTANLDINAIFKVGKLLSDKIPLVHTFVNSSLFVSGLMKYTTIGESGSYDYTHGKWYDLTWFGATATF